MASFLLGRPLAELYLGPDLVGRYKGTSLEWTPSFNPLTLSPVVWLDASDETSFSLVDNGAGSAADRVKQWRDKSGSGNHFSQADGTAFKRPRRISTHPGSAGKIAVVAQSALTALPMANLDLNTPNASLAYLATKISELYIVMAAMNGTETVFSQANGWNGVDGSDGYQAIFSCPNAGLGNPRIMGVLDQPTFIGSNAFASGGYKNGSSTMTGDASTRPALPMPLSAWRFLNTGTTAAQTIQRMLFNQDNGTTGRAWKGPICEVLAFVSPLSESNRSALTQYMMQKWGIAA